MQSANITGQVEFRHGDGPTATIRRGPVDIETTVTDATLSWSEGEVHTAAAMPLSDYERYVAEGAITLN